MVVMTGKRDIQVNVRMSTEDFATLKKAAGTLWPGAILTNAAMILSLAKMAASEVLKEKRAAN